MSAKYAFTKSLKEVRFLFCQTSEHSAAVRYDLLPQARAHAITGILRGFQWHAMKTRRANDHSDHSLREPTRP